MLEIFQYSFMIRAIVAGLIVAIIAPLIGNFLIIRRFSMAADTLSHIALAGVAIGLFTHTQPVLVTTIFTILVAILIEKIRKNKKVSGENILAMFLPGGLAISVILISLAKGFNSNLFSYLFGSISTVTNQEILPILILGLVSLSTIVLLYKPLLFSSFDEDGAKLSGVKVDLMGYVLMVLTAVTVSLAMRIVGILLISSLMIIPNVSAMMISKSFKQSFFYAILIAATSVIFGLYASFYIDLPAGGTITLIALTIFSVISLIKKK